MDLRFLRTHLSNVDLLRLRQMEEACLASLTSHVASHVSLTLNISTCHTWIRTGKKKGFFGGGVKKSCPLITAPIPLSICSSSISSSQFDKHFLLLTHTHFSHMSHPICHTPFVLYITDMFLLQSFHSTFVSRALNVVWDMAVGTRHVFFRADHLFLQRMLKAAGVPLSRGKSLSHTHRFPPQLPRPTLFLPERIHTGFFWCRASLSHSRAHR